MKRIKNFNEAFHGDTVWNTGGAPIVIWDEIYDSEEYNDLLQYYKKCDVRSKPFWKKLKEKITDITIDKGFPIEPTVSNILDKLYDNQDFIYNHDDKVHPLGR